MKSIKKIIINDVECASFSKNVGRFCAFEDRNLEDSGSILRSALIYLQIHNNTKSTSTKEDIQSRIWEIELWTGAILTFNEKFISNHINHTHLTKNHNIFYFNEVYSNETVSENNDELKNSIIGSIPIKNMSIYSSIKVILEKFVADKNHMETKAFVEKFPNLRFNTNNEIDWNFLDGFSKEELLLLTLSSSIFRTQEYNIYDYFIILDIKKHFPTFHNVLPSIIKLFQQSCQILIGVDNDENNLLQAEIESNYRHYSMYFNQHNIGIQYL